MQQCHSLATCLYLTSLSLMHFTQQSIIYNNQHPPIMHPSKPIKQGGDVLSIFWKDGDLTTFADAEHA